MAMHFLLRLVSLHAVSERRGPWKFVNERKAFQKLSAGSFRSFDPVLIYHGSVYVTGAIAEILGIYVLCFDL